MKIVRSVARMRAVAGEWRAAGKRIGFVPTMGSLHEGHLSLVDVAATQADVTAVSIYVNPTQFGAGEDFAEYPRDFERDEAMCRQRGVDAVFYPSDGEMYAPDHSTWVLEEQLSAPLCGRSRPVHFRGVATVVTKLLNMVTPDVAVFGRKDAQQALLIQRLVRDLNLAVHIVVAPIVRDADGLAISSRNRHLSPEQRQQAVSLYRGLQEAEQLYRGGERRASRLVRVARNEIEPACERVDYVELVARTTLQRVETVREPALLAVAACFGSTRLIDNVFLD